MNAAGASRPEIVLGPLLYNWPAEKRRDFYFRIADEAAVDVVHLGEVVCHKRTPFFAPYVPDVVERLLAAGKKVVHATPALVMSDADVALARDLANEPDIVVEANDVGAVSLLRGRPHQIGPFVNVYNEATLAYLARNGARRVCLAAELPKDSIMALTSANLAEIEVMAFGRVPLSISARCYHARAHGLSKDGCQYVCERDLDGMPVETLDHQPMVAVNGLQTLSFTVLNLVDEVAGLVGAGVAAFRLWPQNMDMAAVASVFRAVLDGRMAADEAFTRLEHLAGDDLPFANGYFHAAEGFRLIGAETD